MKNAICILTILFSLLVVNLYSQEEWAEISQPGETLYIVDKDVSFFFYNWPNGSHGSTSFIEKSDDGGHSYSVIWERTGEWGCYYMEELFFLDADTGFFGESCAGTVIYKTTNGGENWSSSGMGGPYEISMFFLREDYGYYTTEGGMSSYYLFRNGEIIFETPDYVFANEHFYFPWLRTELYFKNDSTGLIMCKDRNANAVIIKTTDYGITWTEKLLIPGGKFNDMIFTSEKKGFVAGNAGVLLVTNDFGESWDTLDIPTSQNLNSIDISDDGIGYIAANAGTLLKSTDAGESWSSTNFINTSDLIYVRAFDDDIVFVLDANGKLYSNQSGSTLDEPWMEQINIFPNPVSGQLNIAFADAMQECKISIITLQGNTLIKTTEKKLNLKSVPPGTYIVVIETEKGIYREVIIKR